MLICISPAKKLNWAQVALPDMTTPAFASDTAELVQAARGLSAGDLAKLMKISDALANLNYDRFHNFQTTPDDPRPAVRAFAGDTYVGLDAATMDDDEIRYAQRHLRILSGLYGILRPLDAIQPYRLEMGSRLKTARGKNLYDFWGDRIALALNEAAAQADADTLINCASQEYFGAVDMAALSLRVITPQFMELKGGTPKIVSFYAKQARGAMARFILRHRLNNPIQIRDFDSGGYAWDSELSTDDRPVFVRAAQ